MKTAVEALGAVAGKRHDEVIGRFTQADAAADSRDKAQALRVEAAYDRLVRALVDEAKEGPRLFHFEPLNKKFFSVRDWVSEKFRFTLWCEHSRLPLPVLNFQLGTPDEKRGVYDVTVPREWFATAAPYLKGLGTVLGLVVPLAAPLALLTLDKTVYAGLEKQLEKGQKAAESMLKGTEKAIDWLAKDDAPEFDRAGSTPGSPVRAAGGVLRQLHAWLKDKDPGFGGLVRVLNKRNEYLWVHPKYETEY